MTEFSTLGSAMQEWAPPGIRRFEWPTENTSLLWMRMTFGSRKSSRSKLPAWSSAVRKQAWYIAGPDRSMRTAILWLAGFLISYFEVALGLARVFLTSSR